MEEQQRPQYEPQYKPKKSISPGRAIRAIIIIVIIAIAAIYGYFYFTSDTGRQQFASGWTAITTKYNPLTLLLEVGKETGSQAGRRYGTDYNQTAGEVGIKFEAFETVGGDILPSGTMLAFKYNLDVGEGVEGITPELECNIKSKAMQDIEEEILEPGTKMIRPENIEIYTEDVLSYSNIKCQFKTKKQTADKDLIVEGKLRFPFEQRNSLRVYFVAETGLKGKEFFEKNKIDEKLPIRASYNNEPIELGIAANEEVQPVIVGEDQTPTIGISLTNMWDGRMTKLNSMTLRLPNGVSIDKEASPTSVLCPFGEQTSSGTSFVKYEAEEEYLNLIPEIGKGVKETLKTSQTFSCWLKVDEEILGDKPDTKSEYIVDISYEYEFQPRTETVLLKKIEEGIEEPEEVEE